MAAVSFICRRIAITILLKIIRAASLTIDYCEPNLDQKVISVHPKTQVVERNESPGVSRRH